MFIKIPHSYFDINSPVANLCNPEECRVISCKFIYQGEKYGFYEVIPTSVYKEYLFMYLRHMVHRKHEIIEAVNITKLCKGILNEN